MCGVCFARDKEKSGWPCGTPDSGGNKRSERAGRDFPLFWRQVGAQMRCGGCVFFVCRLFPLRGSPSKKKERLVGGRSFVWACTERRLAPTAGPGNHRVPHTHPIPWSLFLEFLLLFFPPISAHAKSEANKQGAQKEKGEKDGRPKESCQRHGPATPCLSSGPTRRVIRVSNQWGIFIHVVQPERNA